LNEVVIFLLAYEHYIIIERKFNEITSKTTYIILIITFDKEKIALTYRYVETILYNII